MKVKSLCLTYTDGAFHDLKRILFKAGIKVYQANQNKLFQNHPLGNMKREFHKNFFSCYPKDDPDIESKQYASSRLSVKSSGESLKLFKWIKRA